MLSKAGKSRISNLPLSSLISLSFFMSFRTRTAFIVDMPANSAISFLVSGRLNFVDLYTSLAR